MLIVCPSCTTAYDIDAPVLGDGRPVRCARCKMVWVATAEPTPAMADFDPVARTDAFASAADSAAAGADWGLRDVPGEQGGGAEPEDEMAAAMASAMDGPSLVPADGDSGPGVAPPGAETELRPAEDIESFAARRMRVAREARAKRRRSYVSLPLVIILLAGVCAFLLAVRERIVAWAPQSAGFYAAIGLPVNLRGLAFEDIRSSEEIHNKIPVLVVEGTIMNVTDRTVEVPRLRFALRNKDGLEIYAWTALPERQVLSAGEKVAFRSQLASPPEESHDIVVRFFNRRDFASK